MSKKRKLSYIVDASELRVRFTKLKDSIEAINDPGSFIPNSLHNYLIQKDIYEETIENLRTSSKQDYFKSKKLNNYAKFSSGTEKLTSIALNEYNYGIRDYFLELPEKIQELKQIKRELKALIHAADNRAPSLFKTGNVKGAIRDVIDLEEVGQLLSFAEETRDLMEANRELFLSSDSKFYILN
ncbi:MULTISPECIES: hypothetical protein [Legionella]|uniref:Uncharacterized protein n=1 Tax=Legionella steelei TaxID=947033 RepID=A0A0W0ZHB2_9GAMM|nr:MULTISPECIES: hypothetical protein [Legionella]KTD68214.1 hypothetical protein Lste_1372 [Legionella steelei]MBN9226316.1 hypothetical protein [Legionella steelei]OJW12060.1 MAG: hypothetical protein BGO44_03235 [Legionella sp. 39-23]